MDMPKFACYGNYKSGNYGNHCIMMSFGPVTVWFSYQTLVAFHFSGHARVVHANDWGPTTGKHLKWIDGGNKKGRVDDDAFQKLFQEQYKEAFEPKSPFELEILKNLVEKDDNGISSYRESV